MSFTLQRYLSNVFITIILEADSCYLLGKVIKNGKVIDTFETVFDDINEDQINSNIIEYIENKSSKYSDIYICSYYNKLEQGALLGTSKRDFKVFDIDIKSVTQLNMDKTWSIFAPKVDLQSFKNYLFPIELNLLYSPFALMHYCIKSRPKEEEIVLYIYNHEDDFAVGIFKELTLLFGAFFKLDNYTLEGTPKIQNELDDEDLAEVEDGDEEKKEPKQDEGDEETLVALESIPTEDEEIFEFSEFDSMDEMDLEEDIDTTIQNDEAKHDDNLFSTEKSIALLGRDTNMFNHLKNAIKEFYTNTKYQSTFIENVVIFDNDEITQEFTNMIQNQFFMSVRVQKVKTLELMCDMALEEIKL